MRKITTPDFIKTDLIKKNPLLSGLRRLAASAFCLVLTGLVIIPAVEGGEEELTFPLDGWRSRHGSQDISTSSERATRGDKSTRIDYVTTGWQFIQYDFARLDLADWRGGDLFEFDLYIDHPEPLHTFIIQGDGPVGVYQGHSAGELPVEQWLRFTIPLRREPGAEDPFAELDRDSVSRLEFRLWGDRPPHHPAKDVTLYFDNMRVISTAGQRREALASKLRIIAESGLLSGHEPDQVDELRNRLERLETATFDNQKKLEEVTENLLAIEDEAEILINKVIDRALGQRSLQRSAALIKDLGQAEKEYDRPWRTLTEIEEDKQETVLAGRIRALRKAMTMAEERIENLHQQAEIERLYEDADFAIGIPPWPQAWRSDKYHGPIGREVRLRTARHEYEPYQLVVLAHKQDLREVRVSASDLTGDNGRISSDNIEIAPMGWRKLRGEAGWVADMLRADIDRFDLEKGSHQPIWINVYVPENTPAGVYRGTATVSAGNVEPEEIKVAIKVWPFTLPRTASLPTATHCGPARTSEAFARTIIERRWNPFQLYQWGSGADPAWLNKLTEMGATMHNLLRISRHAANYGEDDDGNPVVTNKDLFFRRLDPIVEEIRENYPDLWPHVALYGFDEPSLGQARAMDEFYGELKERYHNIPTMFADLYGLWASFMPENVDIWTVSRGTLTANARDLIQGAGMDVWWWNTYSNPMDPVGIRVQYWSTLKDELDGILQYALDAGGGGTRGRYTPWPLSLWPEEKRVDGGILRRSEDEKPISTVAFEYFREGMEDVEYIYLLRERREALAERVNDDPTDEQQNLLREADRLLRIPDTITTGLFGDRAVDVGEVVVETSGHTEDMNVILATRFEIAELIIAIDEELNKLYPVAQSSHVP